MKALLSLLALPLLAGGVAAQGKPDDEESIMVTITGILRTGVFAVGGETTGTTVTAKKVAFELTFGKNAELQKAAEKLDGKRVVVQGSLERRVGVERGQRLIVTVSRLTEAGKAGPKDKADKTDKDTSEKQSFRATPGRTDSHIRFETEGETTIFDVTSKFGIDKATIRRLDAKWPGAVVVRLHLRSLESFKAGRDDLTVEWSAGEGDSAPRVSVHRDGKETQADEDSPYYTKARIARGTRRYFEVPLPAKLFEGNPAEITLHWVDFYRD